MSGLMDTKQGTQTYMITLLFLDVMLIPTKTDVYKYKLIRFEHRSFMIFL